MSSDDSDDDFTLTELKKKKKKRTSSASAASTKSSSKKRKATPDPAPSSSSSKKKRKADPVPSASSPTKKKAKKDPKALKKLEKGERLQYAMQSFLWWDAKEPPEGCQWSTMEHAGVSFPEPYEPHGVKLLYDGEPVDLTPVQEEA